MKLKQNISRRQVIQVGLLTGAANVAGGLMGKIAAAEARVTRPVRFETIAEGFVDKRDPKGPLPRAGTSRAAVTKEGDLVCTYGLRSKVAGNDSVPVTARSRDGGLTWKKPVVMWPHLQGKLDIYGSVSRSPARRASHTRSVFLARSALLHIERIKGGLLELKLQPLRLLG